MAVEIRITDGTTTIDLMNDFSPGVTHYSPGTSIGAVGEDDPDITETINVYSKGANPESVYQIIRSIERLFVQAEQYRKTKAGARVFIQFKPSGTMTYRSEILKGKITYKEDQLRINQAASIVDFQVMFTRRMHWETNEEIQIPLLNSSVAQKTTNAVTIYNHFDTDVGHNNYVQIANTDVTGTMPGAIRIALVNTTEGAYDDYVFIGLATHGVPGSIPHFLEGEDNSGSSDQADTTCSNGSFGRFSTTPSWGLKGVWALNTTQAQALAGRYYRCVARFKTRPSAISYCYLSTHLTGSTVEQTTTQQTTLSTTNYLQELGVLRLPPWLTAQTGLQAFDIGLNLKTSNSSNIDIDYIALIPTDGFRVIKFVGNGAGNTNTIMLDEIDGLCYLQTSGGAKTANLSLYGTPLMVWPGKTQRLYFLTQDTTPAAPIDSTHTVQVWYRARRESL